MKSIYDAAHLADAYLVKNLLEEHGIAAFVRGEHLHGGMGELPMGGLMQVCVAEADAQRGRAIIEDWQRAPVDDAGFDFDDGAEDAPGALGVPVVAGDDQAPRVAAPSPSSRLVPGLLVGAAIGAALTWWSLRGPSTQAGLDFDHDGRADERLLYEGDVLVGVESDRNFDGKVDQVFVYDAQGLPDRTSDDDDFDGRMETVTHYQHGHWKRSQSDFDGDGFTDHRSEAVQGVLYSEEWLDPAQNVVKRIIYRNGRADRGEIDSDGDGTLDAQRRYDARGEVVP